MKKASLILIILYWCLTVSPASADRVDIKIIVNPDNPITMLSKDEVADVFMKKVTRWQDGGTILPVDLPEDSAARESFCVTVLDKTISQIKATWMHLLFSGKSVPPVVKETEKDVVEYVRTNRYAIGYVSHSTTIKDVKVVDIQD
ncbi:substrate-binding domain-containing protein [bacterium]|nr:substrate-binding domain-containing protein [bacterium]